MCEKRKNWSFIKMTPANCKRYATMENCYEILENGIEAVLFGYDSNQQDLCTLVLDKARTTIKVI